MTINSTLIISTVRTIEITTSIGGKRFVFQVHTVNGKIQGDYKTGIATSDGKYFSAFTEETKKHHFQQIKVHVENNYTDITIKD